MPIAIQEIANEQSTFGIPIVFSDDVGAAVIPNAGTLTWTLTDLSGNVVNSRTAVPATVQCLYNSTLGTDLEWKEEIYFEISPLLMVV